MHDPYGAFVAHDPAAIDGAGAGPLAGLTFAAKDLFDIAGHVTGCGNPDWRATHGPAAATAPGVQTLLNAGARLVGKPHTDELAFSLLCIAGLGRLPQVSLPLAQTDGCPVGVSLIGRRGDDKALLAAAARADAAAAIVQES